MQFLVWALAACGVVILFQNCSGSLSTDVSDVRQMTYLSSGVGGVQESVVDRNLLATGLFESSPQRGSLGAFFDGPIHPWKDARGNVYFNIPHKQNYRVKVPQWEQPGTWQLERSALFDSKVSLHDQGGRSFHRAGACGSPSLEADYDNAYWLIGFWAEGDQVFSLAHHEYYTHCNSAYNMNTHSQFNRGWVNTIMPLVSSDGGATFKPKSYVPYASSGQSNSTRAVVVPEPSSSNPNGSGFGHYGFLHPSNIVKEGNYHYAFADYRSIKTAGSDSLRIGVIMIRSSNIQELSNWEVLTEQGWKLPASFVGNIKGLQPKVFFESESDIYTKVGATNLMGLSIHKHTPTGLWLLFGFNYEKGAVVVTASKTLATPLFDKSKWMLLPDSSSMHPYVSVVDHNSSDQNFMSIGNEVHLYYINHQGDYGRYLLRKKYVLIDEELKQLLNEEVAPPPPPQDPPNPDPSSPPRPPPPPPSGVKAYSDFIAVNTNLYGRNASTTKSYCQFTSMAQFKDLTGYGVIPENLTSRLSAYSGDAQFSGLCAGASLRGIFAVGIDLLYSNGAEYCKFPSVEIYTARTGLNSLPADAFVFPKYPSQIPYVGLCR